MLVSHDIDEALKLGDRIAVFRQGRIVQCASPDELLAKPANEFVGSFVGQDRTLKRLLLVSAGDVTDQQPTITVRESTPLPEASPPWMTTIFAPLPWLMSTANRSAL